MTEQSEVTQPSDSVVEVTRADREAAEAWRRDYGRAGSFQDLLKAFARHRIAALAAQPRDDVRELPWAEIEKLCEAADKAAELITDVRAGARREKALDVLPQGMGKVEQKALRSATLAVRRKMGKLAALATTTQPDTDSVLEAARKAIVSYAFQECQPDRGDVFSWIDDHAETIAKTALAEGAGK